MKRLLSLLIFISIVMVAAAQDEGIIKKRERIDKNKGVFLGLGPSFTFGKNIGDYKTGFNVELGFLKRVNRVLSIGPSISYLGFQYDPEVTTANGGDAYIGYGDPNGWETKYGLGDLAYDYGYVLTLEGGDLSLTSLALNIKLNFVPVKDNSVISVYAFAKPFVTLASRKEVSGTGERYTYEIYEDDQNTSTQNDDLLYYNQNDGQWYADGYTETWDGDSFETLKSDTEITGGIFVGPGIELFPARPFSFYLQAAFGYTFPVTFVSTEAYEKTVSSYANEEFPMVKKGFPSLNIQFGVSYNF
ncbi:hypothetical protein [Ohtaekwangia koreensis]|uniref:Outer membrane protein beta-barrel domain-containing protein n=1 Tax=Ohtaekwangia koreensis TaxID=688867 RepID=A0A1T5KGX2_9BACT|nr:hypothetical protein [Ohtaekwangia koreensis]SKC62719.1 hypothetical protein SAMN05660236_2156 [Ohtaekwangia koreensis]